MTQTRHDDGDLGKPSTGVVAKGLGQLSPQLLFDRQGKCCAAWVKQSPICEGKFSLVPRERLELSREVVPADFESAATDRLVGRAAKFGMSAIS